MKRPQKQPKLLAAKAVLGIVLLAIGAFAVSRYWEFEAGAVHSTGVVRRVERHVHTGGRRGRMTTITPLIEFVPQGQTVPIQVPTTTEERPSLSVGDEVAIEYLPQRPETSLMLDHGFPVVDGAVGLGGVWLVVSAITGVVRRRRLAQMSA